MGYIMDMRKLVGKRAIFMPAAGAAIINENNEILLQRRTDNKCWGIPGGSMELGETFEETAVREVKEETGLDVNRLELFNIFSGEDLHYVYPNGDEVYITTAVFLCNDYSGDLRRDEEESLELRFFKLNDIPVESDLNPPDRVIISKLKDYLVRR
ncbi:NUDIX hydrolase [Oceanirhabdus sp. W0125-5]|uniref:NUDIX hydrolase n=1 Tax=Oceanirhabdus sp. W0125-5 TaxID=2999116 RepID=UPI0022F2D3EE|nr:NUDIX hydrolase [Oceanirhabdus sp. W0125-5]WBW97453.1 NUDIX hydrolase [Oceanirhabdus sp. W0125-5]